MLNKWRANQLASRVNPNQKGINETEKGNKQPSQLPQHQFNFSSYVLQHKQACMASLQRLYRTPFATLMTLLVIGIAIALPSFLYVVLNNAEGLSKGWDNHARISLYLSATVSDSEAQSLVNQVSTWPDVGKVTYISPTQGLQEFAQQSGLGDAVSQLPANPLPGVIEVEPSAQVSSSQAIANLLSRLQALSEVAHAQLDMQWIQRLYGIIDVAQTGVYALAFLLGLGVLLIVGNTIRLATQNYQDEIVTIKLVGGTDAFIRRPFLYSGLFFGLFGGVIAWILVGFTIIALQVSASHLAALYQSTFKLHNLGFFEGLMLLVIAGGIGLLGSWFVVNRHLLEVEPT